MDGLVAWLLDDWEEAWGRTLARRIDLSAQRMAMLRAQWRIGQGVKGLLLFLPLMLVAALLAPDGRAGLRGPLALWAAAEGALCAAQVALILRSGYSYGWALHHRRPRVLMRVGAQRDAQAKALLAALAFTVALLALALL